MADEWTPYGLEHLRARSNRKRRLVAVGVVAFLAGAWALVSDTAIDTQVDVLANGGRNTVQFDVPPEQRDAGPDARVRIEPGRIVRAPDGTGAGTPPASEASRAPAFEADPINWLEMLLRYGPYAVVAAVLWLGFRRRGRADEVNYGIYKGAMPLESITASHAHVVLTGTAARASLFGRRQEDHVPGEPESRVGPVSGRNAP